MTSNSNTSQLLLRRSKGIPSGHTCTQYHESSKKYKMKKQIFMLIAIIGFCYQSLNAQTNNEPPRPPKPPTIEERLKLVNEKIAKELTLTKEQKQKIEAAYKDFFTKTEELHKKMPPPPPPPPLPKEVMDKLSGERDAEIKKVLTGDQFKKYMDIEKTLRPKPPGNQPPPPEIKKN